jgi:hypothetical protein
VVLRAETGTAAGDGRAPDGGAGDAALEKLKAGSRFEVQGEGPPVYAHHLFKINGLRMSIYSGIYIFCLIWPFRQARMSGGARYRRRFVHNKGLLILYIQT